MKLFVTGAGGFVGAEVVRRAAAAGHTVVATVRPGSSAQRLDIVRDTVEIVSVDLRDKQSTADALKASNADAIIHIAWRGVGNKDRFDYSQIGENVDASCQLVESGIAFGVQKFVGIGSQGEYGVLDGPIDERHLPEPTALYGAAKVATMHLTRQLAAQGGIEFAWMRLFSTFGPDDNPGWLIPFLITEMLEGRRPRTTLGTQLWDYLYISDVADGILAAATTKNAVGVFNLGSGRPVAVRHLIETIRDLTAPTMELVFGEIPFRPDQVLHMEADISRLQRATGWSPGVELDRGLAETVAWYRHRLRGVVGKIGGHA